MLCFQVLYQASINLSLESPLIFISTIYKIKLRLGVKILLTYLVRMCKNFPHSDKIKQQRFFYSCNINSIPCCAWSWILLCLPNNAHKSFTFVAKNITRCSNICLSCLIFLHEKGNELKSITKNFEEKIVC